MPARKMPGMTRESGLSLVMPTVGRSPHQGEALAALRRDVAGLDQPTEILVVAQGDAAALDFPGATKVLRAPNALGFAAANNWGFREARYAVLGTINDDALVEPGFCARLLACFDEPQVAAAQGLNWQLAAEPAKLDGAGIRFNPWWQAVQRGFGLPPGTAYARREEIFGVSATAAFYRAAALEAVALSPGRYFEEELQTYYEDVELAIRLRAHGYRAVFEPAARAHHAGSASLSTLRFGGRALIHGNRLLVLARLFGRGYWFRLPWLMLRDFIDLGHLARRGQLAGALGVLLGLGRAARHLGHFAHRGPGLLPPEALSWP